MKKLRLRSWDQLKVNIKSEELERNWTNFPGVFELTYFLEYISASGIAGIYLFYFS